MTMISTWLPKVMRSGKMKKTAMAISHGNASARRKPMPPEQIFDRALARALRPVVPGALLRLTRGHRTPQA